jgi:hypothetical protein
LVSELGEAFGSILHEVAARRHQEVHEHKHKSFLESWYEQWLSDVNKEMNSTNQSTGGPSAAIAGSTAASGAPPALPTPPQRSADLKTPAAAGPEPLRGTLLLPATSATPARAPKGTIVSPGAPNAGGVATLQPQHADMLHDTQSGRWQGSVRKELDGAGNADALMKVEEKREERMFIVICLAMLLPMSMLVLAVNIFGNKAQGPPATR